MASLGWCLAELPPSFTKLEDNLSGVKTLFKAKLGENVDYDNEKESELRW